MFKLLLLLSTTILFAKSDFDNSFITKFEYGKMLYANPRGISCIKCHGNNAQGKKIATFIHVRNKIKYNCTIQSEDITNISYNEFLTKLDPKIKKKSIQFAKDEVCKKLIYGNSMPTYFLTKEELDSIYFYLKNQKNYQ